MKNLPLKLAVLVVVIIAVTIMAMLIRKPLRLHYYESKLDSDDVNTRRHAVEKLLTLGPEGELALNSRFFRKNAEWVGKKFGEPKATYPFPFNITEPAALWVCYERFIVFFNARLEVMYVKEFNLEKAELEIPVELQGMMPHYTNRLTPIDDFDGSKPLLKRPPDSGK
ncbi:MAG: hypothetical protein ACYS8W_03070 [Planctomycetota bacterium]